MENIAYVGLSQQIALNRQIETVAHNIANASTPGFQASGTLFTTHLNSFSTDETQDLSQVATPENFRNTSNGILQETGNTFDLALQGEGYFAVQGPNEVIYTRSGNFALNDQGTLVTQQGYAVLGENGPIQFTNQDQNIQISGTGRVSTSQGELDALQLLSFEDQQSMTAIGNGFFLAENPVPAENITVRQGAIEGSNVQAITESTKMIEILRTYQAVQRMVQSDHDRQRSTIRTLTETN